MSTVGTYEVLTASCKWHDHQAKQDEKYIIDNNDADKNLPRVSNTYKNSSRMLMGSEVGSGRSL